MVIDGIKWLRHPQARSLWLTQQSNLKDEPAVLLNGSSKSSPRILSVTKADGSRPTREMELIRAGDVRVWQLVSHYDAVTDVQQ